MKKIIQFVLVSILWFFGITILWVVIYRFVPPPITFLMIQRLTVQTFGNEDVRFKKDWERLNNISDNLKKAVIAAEDANFFEHYGFDFKAIEKAIEKNKRSKKTIGASTISQQVAKNVFLWQGRSWLRKGFEVYFTTLIELIWNKKRIMEVYLNVIEMGNGVYGAEAACQYYYKKSAKSLTKNEAAGIAAILPNPRYWNPVKSSAFVAKKKLRIVRDMGTITDLPF